MLFLIYYLGMVGGVVLKRSGKRSSLCGPTVGWTLAETWSVYLALLHHWGRDDCLDL